MKRILKYVTLALAGIIVGYMLVPTMLLAQTQPTPTQSSTWSGIKSLYAEPDATAPQRDQLQTEATAANITWWRSLSQENRNTNIYYMAARDLGLTNQPNCKEWVRSVVYRASSTVVTIPQTLPDASGWYFSSSPYLARVDNIRSVRSGWLVQLNWKTTYNYSIGRWNYIPHTMIIAEVYSSGIWVIEANWTPGTVAYRWIDFPTFDSKVLRYSCYYVTGG